MTEPSSDNMPWLPVAEAISAALAGLPAFETETPQLRGDLTQLVEVGSQLRHFCATIDSHTRDSRHLWHELRNLAGTIQGYCELILEEAHAGRVAICVNRIAEQCRDLLIYEQQRQSLPAFSTQNQHHRNIAKSTLLIVDDRQESREILARHLQDSPHRIFEAASGQQMFAVLEREPVDLILLDLIMPDTDGYELLLKLKADERFRALPVIVISGSQDQGRIIACIEAGADDYQFKPFNPVLLHARVSACLERKQWLDLEAQYRSELERNQQFIRHVFGRYLSQEIVEQLLEDPDGLELGGEERTVTVMMADINGFTTICEKLSPSRVVKLLNNYLGAMSEVVMAHGGTVDEFIGDAVLALFGAPVTHTDDADRAIKCALAMQNAVSDVNQRNRRDNLPDITLSIALHTGAVVAGNIGSEKRTKYGVVGHTVNQTSRIEDACPPGAIVISQATIEATRLPLKLSDKQVIRAKGIFNAITLCELYGVLPDQERRGQQ